MITKKNPSHGPSERLPLNAAKHSPKPEQRGGDGLEESDERFDIVKSNPVFEFPPDFVTHFGPLGQPYFSSSIRDRFDWEISQLRATPPVGIAFNISYIPDDLEYHERVRRNRQKGLLKIDVPHGWPRALEGPLIWRPEQFQDETKFVHRLSETELEEIDDALKYFNAQGLHIRAVMRSSFPLPGLGDTLTKIKDTVYSGRGFAIIRGLELTKYNPDDRAVVYLGLSSYIGEDRGSQDRRGTMIKHIMDDERGESQSDLPYHTDEPCDVIALMRVRCSKYGGRSTIASAWSVYNELASTMPHVIHTLAKPDWPFDTFGRDPPFYYRAPLSLADGKIIFNYSRRLLVGHPQYGRSPGVPKLSEAQAEALDAVHFTARKLQLSISMEEGDIQFINNMGLLHGREWFHDDNTSLESERHVMRLWLRNTESQWKVPPTHELMRARIFDDPEREEQWHVEAVCIDGVWYGRGYRSECA